MIANQPCLIDDTVTALLGELPALFLTGPRATGKTTAALGHADTAVRLDRAAEVVAFGADPDAAMRGLMEPVLLDEWQVVPDVIGAVKRAVDTDPRPGRFMGDGSRAGFGQPRPSWLRGVAVRGGFPEPILRLGADARAHWLEGVVVRAV